MGGRISQNPPPIPAFSSRGRVDAVGPEFAGASGFATGALLVMLVDSMVPDAQSRPERSHQADSDAEFRVRRLCASVAREQCDPRSLRGETDETVVHRAARDPRTHECLRRLQGR